MKILIIEDEKLTARDLSRIILDCYPDFQIVSMIPSVAEAIEFLKRKPEIDLIFSDIELNDGLSFEIFNELEVSIPIIFCTAFNHYALNAFQANGIDYILKPVSKENVQKSFDKISHIANNRQFNLEQFRANLAEISNEMKLKPKTSILVKKTDSILPILISQIAIVYLDLGTVKVKTFDGSRYALSQKMEELELILGDVFFRVNRQIIINRNAVKEVSQYFHRKLLIHPKVLFDEEIIVGKEKSSQFLHWLEVT